MYDLIEEARSFLAGKHQVELDELEYIGIHGADVDTPVLLFNLDHPGHSKHHSTLGYTVKKNALMEKEGKGS